MSVEEQTPAVNCVTDESVLAPSQQRRRATKAQQVPQEVPINGCILIRHDAATPPNPFHARINHCASSSAG